MKNRYPEFVRFYFICFSLGLTGSLNSLYAQILPENYKAARTENWISIEYLECMKKHLPCECMEYIEFPLLVIDTTSLTFVTYENGNDSRNEFYIKQNKNYFEVYVLEKDSIPIFVLKFENQKLIIKNGIKIIEYKPYYDLNNIDAEEPLLGILNRKLFLESFKLHEGDITDKLNITDSTTLDCNNEIGHINLLFTTDECKEAVIIEEEYYNVLLYKYLNACQPRSYPIKIDKELKFKFEH